MEASIDEMSSTAMGKKNMQIAKRIFLYDQSDTIKTHNNNFTDDILDYISKINKDICSSIGYTRIANMNLITKIYGDYKAVTFAN